MQTQRKSFTIFCEDDKERRITPWDLDCMTSAQLEAAMGASRASENPNPSLAVGPIGSISGLVTRLFSDRL